MGSGNKRTASEPFTPSIRASSYSKRLKTEPNFEVDVHDDSLDLIGDGGDPGMATSSIFSRSLFEIKYCFAWRANL